MGEAPKRSHLAAPYIINDKLPGGVRGMVSMADGQRYDSKSAYYASLKDRGCEIVGNEQPKPWRHEPSDREVHAAAKEAYDQLTSANLSNDEMANMVRAQVPAEEIIPVA